jgi:hypothetical protein
MAFMAAGGRVDRGIKKNRCAFIFDHWLYTKKKPFQSFFVLFLPPFNFAFPLSHFAFVLT